MPTIKLQILGEDILTSIYYSNDDCPIARAFKRLGFKNVFVYPAIAILNHQQSDESRIEITELNTRIRMMYLYKYTSGESGIIPADFEYELAYE